MFEASEEIFLMTSTPKEEKERTFHNKKLKLSLDFNNSFPEVTNTPLQPTPPSNDITDILNLILQKQTNLEARMDILEQKIPEKNDVMAQQKVMRECKVLIKKVHKIVRRISGEADNDIHTELATLMPLMTIGALFDIEEKLKTAEYEEAMKTYIFSLKGASGNISDVMRKMFCDEVVHQFNWDGRSGKKSLMKLKIVNDLLFDTFMIKGRIEFEKDVKKYVENSHNRFKQKRYLERKQQSKIVINSEYKLI